MMKITPSGTSTNAVNQMVRPIAIDATPPKIQPTLAIQVAAFVSLASPRILDRVR